MRKDRERGVALAAALTAAWVGKVDASVQADDVLEFFRRMHASIQEAAIAEEAVAREAAAECIRAVSVEDSLASKDHIVSMIDGKRYQALGRHLWSRGMTPDEYRALYNLPPDYPMMTESYRIQRREIGERTWRERKAGSTGENGPDFL